MRNHFFRCPCLMYKLPLFHAWSVGKLRISTIAAVFADRNERFIGCHTVAALVAGSFDLIPKVDIIVLQQLDFLPVRECIFKIDISSSQQIEILEHQSIDTHHPIWLSRISRTLRIASASAALSAGSALTSFRNCCSSFDTEFNAFR